MEEKLLQKRKLKVEWDKNLTTNKYGKKTFPQTERKKFSFRGQSLSFLRNDHNKLSNFSIPCSTLCQTRKAALRKKRRRLLKQHTHDAQEHEMNPCNDIALGQGRIPFVLYSSFVLRMFYYVPFNRVGKRIKVKFNDNDAHFLSKKCLEASSRTHDNKN
ncbi:CLUMA_CG001188, isoform A [Clunio marinus]|uniref:CLUMA_CG001188, isoform A n=1 Tax=Clunio marinus TaxID=568069 RepID=A0A1J1HIK1_9DIPT|nr:CLUMA_CG001188, isoform A [Clunio marinus]